MNRPSKRQTGFSLVELTVVLVIVALLSSGLLLGLGAQRDAANNSEAQRQLEQARESLYGFAMTNGRLPCPATPTLPDTDANAGKENCALQHGVLPWVTLGLPEIDPWGFRLTYFASSKFTGALPAGALASFTLTTGIAPDNAGTANIKDSAGAGYNIASDLPAVIVSHGKRSAGAYQTSGGKLPGAAGDEAENADADQTFVAHTPTEDFDDLVVWIVPTVLKSRMVAVGKLP